MSQSEQRSKVIVLDLLSRCPFKGGCCFSNEAHGHKVDCFYDIYFLMTPTCLNQASLLKLDVSSGLSELECDKNDQWPFVSRSSCVCQDYVTLSLVKCLVFFLDARSDQGEVKHLTPL